MAVWETAVAVSSWVAFASAYSTPRAARPLITGQASGQASYRDRPPPSITTVRMTRGRLAVGTRASAITRPIDPFGGLVPIIRA